MDVRLLSTLAEAGRASIVDVALRAGVDPREAAARLTALGGQGGMGLPLLVGVECDPQGIRAAVTQLAPPAIQQAPPPPPPPPAAAPIQHPVPRYTAPPPAPRASRGKVGQKLGTDTLSVHLVEVMDPADFLFTAAGHTLTEGQRAIIVHTEITNHGAETFTVLPDRYLVLITDDGQVIGKSDATMNSRPAHRAGVAPGETVGGHTIFLLPEPARLTAVRWDDDADPDNGALHWEIPAP
ncbi:AsnC family protein [Pseudonocardiaceae bacterium YIM PH 21723]|nr:AsnC family protein [Pseudonocardiaceae bacterium YIM PH 21723]